MTFPQSTPPQDEAAAPPPAGPVHGHPPPADFDGLADKKPEELTEEELRLMADTMPGESPGDD